MVEIDDRQREILRLLWREGRMSRWELHKRTGVNPNAIGEDVAKLLTRGIVRECPGESAGPGRPRVPVEVDTLVRHVVGLAISPGRVEVARLSLRGALLGKPSAMSVADASKIVPAAAGLLREAVNERTLSIGLSVTGMVEPATHTVLQSSSLPSSDAASLAPLYEVAGNRPLVLENNMAALGAAWLMTHQAESKDDVLLVNLGDGEMGAALLVEGKPNRGCAIGANELGHMRFFADTDICYCGHAGCLERICSTGFLRRRGITKDSLLQCAARYDESNLVVKEVLDYLSMGLANVVNFMRPHCLVLGGNLVVYPAFMDALVRMIRSRVLESLLNRVRIELWGELGRSPAEAAGWLAIASLYREGWITSEPR